MHSTGLISNLSNKFIHNRCDLRVSFTRCGLNSCLNPCYIYARPDFSDFVADCMSESYINSW